MGQSGLPHYTIIYYLSFIILAIFIRRNEYLSNPLSRGIILIIISINIIILQHYSAFPHLVVLEAVKLEIAVRAKAVAIRMTVEKMLV